MENLNDETNKSANEVEVTPNKTKLESLNVKEPPKNSTNAWEVTPVGNDWGGMNLKDEINKVVNEVELLPPSPEPENRMTILKQRMILLALLKLIKPVDFYSLAKLQDGEKLTDKHTQIIVIEVLLALATENKWSLCVNNGFIYIYNSQSWEPVKDEELQQFLGMAAEIMGVNKFSAKHHSYRKKLMNQFISQTLLPRPEYKKGMVLVNLLNGTFEITPESSVLRNFDPADFLRYQLDFRYDPDAKAPMFENFINRVLPDKDCQKVLAEFFGSIFIRTETLKLEKALLLYGEGANGKSVIYELMNALLGERNVSSYSLQSLMDQSGYYGAMLANKLLNYASELSSSDLEVGLFKQLTSGEPVEARMIFRPPITVRDYSKLAFNCNVLPKSVEHTPAYFRRFIIIPFTVTIPENEQDRELVKKIIAAGELSGIFNWVLDGLKRLLSQKGFTHSDAIEKELAKYRHESDNVKMFLDENNYEEYLDSYISVKELGTEYGEYCKAFRYMPLNHGNFVKRLRNLGVRIEKRNTGLVAFIRKGKVEVPNGELSKSELIDVKLPDFGNNEA